MRDIERDVKHLLESMAEDAGELGDLPRGVQRKARLRRAAVTVGGVILVAGLVVGGGVAASRMFSNNASPVRPLPASSEHEPEAPQDMDGQPVATGTFDGVHWWLSAYVDGEHGICSELATEEADGLGGSGAGCGPFDPDKHPIGLSVQSGGGVSIAHGEVPEHVERLELILANGERVSVDFYPKPEGFPLPVKFYVIAPFPESEAQELVAYDDSGAEMGRQEIVASRNLPNTQRIAGPFLIDRGEHEGIPYVLRGRVDEQELNEGGTWVYPCTTIMVGEDGASGGGGSCHIPVARDNSLSFSQSAFEGGSTIVVHGGAREEVDRVTVELDSGEGFEAELYEIEGTDFRFFLVFPDAAPEDLVGHVVAYKGSVELDRVELCNPQMVSLGGACGP